MRGAAQGQLPLLPVCRHSDHCVVIVAPCLAIVATSHSHCGNYVVIVTLRLFEVDVKCMAHLRTCMGSFRYLAAVQETGRSPSAVLSW